MLFTFCEIVSALHSRKSKQGENWLRTKSGIQHVKSHLVALLGTSDGHQTLVAVILRLVDLDHTATQVPDLVDLSTTLTDDSTDHVVRDVDLLGHWLSRDDASRRNSSSRGVGLNRCRCAIRSGLMGTSAGIRSTR